MRSPALDASDGSQLWTYQTGGRVSGSPAVAGGVLYVGSSDDKLYAIQASNGTLEWTFTAGGPIFSSPAFADGRVWFGSQAGVFYGVAIPAGCEYSWFITNCWPAHFESDLCWASTGGGAGKCAKFDQALFHTMAVSNGFVYLGTTGTKMYGLAG